jgi:hypothetical protein
VGFLTRSLRLDAAGAERSRRKIDAVFALRIYDTERAARASAG